MSWYYVGPDAKPIGPITLEELQSRRASGAVAPETYVIEAPAGSAPKEWRRYRDIFPAATGSALPPLPAATAAALPAAQAPTIGIPSPIFPTPPPAMPSPGSPVFTGTHPSTYRLPPGQNNPWCSWGFGLGILSVPFLFCMGLGVLPAIGGLIASIVGLAQVGRHREQHGRGLAIIGLVLSIVTLLIVLSFGIAVMAGPLRKAIEATTEQTANDSDTR